MASDEQKKLINSDYWGGCTVLLIVLFFWLQLSDDFTPFGVFFPERVMPLLTLLGIALLIKGRFAPSMRPNFLRGINTTMLTTMLCGTGWVIAFEPLGFVLSSFVAVMIMLIVFAEKEERTFAYIAKSAVGTLICMGTLYLIFVHFLNVTLPKGRLLEAFI